MGAKFKPYKIKDSQLDKLDIIEGQWIVTDSGKIYFDYSSENTDGTGGERILIGATALSDVSIDDRTITFTSLKGETKTVTVPGSTYTAGNGLSLVGSEFRNEAVLKISSGSTNGTIKVVNGKKNGTNETIEVAIAGLGTAAFTDSDDYVTKDEQNENKYTKLDLVLGKSAWEGDVAPYSISIPIEGITDNDDIQVLPDPNITVEQAGVWMNAGVLCGNVESEKVILKAFNIKPTIDVPIVILYKKDFIKS